MKRISRQRQSRPWILFYLVPLLWSAIGSSTHNPGACVGSCPSHLGTHDEHGAHSHHDVDEQHAHGDGEEDAHYDEADDESSHHRHAAELAFRRVSTSHLSCLECQWLSAATLLSPAFFKLNVAHLQRAAFASANLSYLVATVTSPSSRGPPTFF